MILLDALGTHQRILDDINQFLADWDSVLSRLDENIKILEQYLSRDGYKTGIKTKDIFDNIQIFFPIDDPHTEYINLSGDTPIWWTLQHSADLLTNLIRYGITKNIYLRGCISMGYIREYRNGYFSTAMIENANFAGSCEMIGVIVSPTAMRVLNNKTYFSSSRFFQYVKCLIPIKDPTRIQRKRFPTWLDIKQGLSDLLEKSRYRTYCFLVFAIAFARSSLSFSLNPIESKCCDNQSLPLVIWGFGEFSKPIVRWFAQFAVGYCSN